MSAFDKCASRPAHIDAILNGLDRYNPETTSVFQDYVAQQCEDKTFDAYANLALLKLYQFNPHLLNTETSTNILTKALTVFPSPSFSLALSLLPAHTQPLALSQQQSADTSAAAAALPTSDFTESVQKLTLLNTLLESAQYAQFWSTLNSDDLYADLVADVTGFEELVRVRIAVEVGKGFREVDLGLLATWLDLRGNEEVAKFVEDVCEWTVDQDKGLAVVARNSENEAKGEVRGEKIGIEMFRRVLGRGFEEPA